MTTWDEFTDLRFDYLLLRDHEHAALEILFEYGTEEGEGYGKIHMPWQEFLIRFERELPRPRKDPYYMRLHLTSPTRLAKLLETPSRYRALYTERVGSGWRIMTDLQPQTDPEERAETSEEGL